MEILKLGNVIEFKSGTSNLPKDYKIDGDIPFINYKDVYLARPIQIETLKKIKVFKNDNYEKNMANFNDLIMTSSSETSIDNGMISIYTGENPVLVNGFCKILKINNEKIINKYLFYLFNNKKYRKLISNCSNGITRHNILWYLFKKIDILIPNIDEQKAIIDIIEPYEALFLKYINLVRIDTYQNCLSDMKTIIDIIEPFEKLLFELEQNNDYFLLFLKNIYLLNINNKEAKDLSLNDFVKNIKNSNNNYDETIDLSSIKSNSLIMYKFKNTSNFLSNIFEIEIGDIFFSSIRPKLKKFGISHKNMNILGTLFNLRPLDFNNRGTILTNIVSDNFQEYLISISEGTKMPIVKWKKIQNYKFRIIDQKYCEIQNLIFDKILENNKKMEILNKVISNLIEIYVI